MKIKKQLSDRFAGSLSPKFLPRSRKCALPFLALAAILLSSHGAFAQGTVVGGSGNTATGALSVVTGGFGNSATATNSVIVGGNSCTAAGQRSVVVGGTRNRTTAAGEGGVVVTGNLNTSSGNNAAVLTGRSNTAGGANSAIVAGSNNTVTGAASLAAGNFLNDEGSDGRMLFGDSDPNGTRAGNGGITPVSQTAQNAGAGGPDSFRADFAGGIELIGTTWARDGVTTGVDLDTQLVSATTANQGPAFNFNFPGGTGALLENTNTAGTTSTGLFFNSTSAGIWSPGNNGKLISFYDSGAGGPLVESSFINFNGVYNQVSDRNRKEQIQEVDSREVLDSLVTIPISTWRYKVTEGRSNEPEIHMGPMAQDFHAAFLLGGSDKHIGTVDADGVALAAIKGLNEKLEEEISAKDERIQELSEAAAALEERLARLEQQLGSGE